ncbi:low-density lipoprotein receptor class A repeat-containing protein, partial [Candidatus Sororendozoicomonas aggregata]|uniref:low-density lipoprotein receptor class A repeat-containing protein n=1 Tax=Candidatus Sororendozoicomonas aggregata TaxID=3073239 RepID=UPI002ED3E156
ALTEKAEVKEKTFSEKLLLLGSGADDYDIRHPRLDQLKTLVQLFCQAGLGDKTTKDLLVPIVYNAAKHPGHNEYLRQAALLFTELPDDSQSTRQRVDEHIGFVVNFFRGDEDHTIAALNKSEYRDYIEENTYFDSDDNSEEHWEALRQSCCEIYNASDIAPSAMTASREGGNGDNPTSVSSGKAGGGTGMASGIKTVLSTALCTLLSAGVGATPAPATTGESATSPSNASDWREVCPDSITDKECARILHEECEYGLNNNYLGAGCEPNKYNCLSYNKTKTGEYYLCIPDDWPCDDEKDCSRESEESSDAVNDDESSRLCDRCQSNGYYKCGRKCVPDSDICDGCDDCLHGSDEKPPFCIQYRLHNHVQRQCPDISGSAGIDCVQGVFQRCLDRIPEFSDEMTDAPRVKPVCQKETTHFNMTEWQQLCPERVSDNLCKSTLLELCEYGTKHNYLGYGCGQDDFNCGHYGEKICESRDRICDDTKHCPDHAPGSDEHYALCNICETDDSKHGFKCDGRCLSESKMCDGRWNCNLLFDERNGYCIQHSLVGYILKRCPDRRSDRGNDCVLGTFKRCLAGVRGSPFTDEVTEASTVIFQETQPRTTQARTTGKTQRLKPTKPPSNQPVSKDNRGVIKTRENNASMANATFSTMTGNKTRVPVSGGRSTIRPTRNASGLSSGNSNESQASGQSGFSTAAIVGTTIPVLIAAGAIGGALYWQRDNISQFLSSRFPGFKPFNLGARMRRGDGDDTVELNTDYEVNN